jgi:predicted phage tail protein
MKSLGLLAPVVLIVSPGLFLMTGCGYPAEPSPPALNRPLGVRDLAAVERGDKILIHFTIPRRTTDDLPVKGTPDLELRIGPMPRPKFETPDWERNSERIPVGDIHVAQGVASAEIPVAKFAGNTEVIGVRVLGPNGGNVGWSNFEVVTVVPPLPVPAGLEAKDAPDAVRLDWRATAPEFRIFRRVAGEKGENDSDFVLLGTTTKPFYIDSTIDYGRAYKYAAQSIERIGDKYAESDLSEEVTFKPTDRFPPAVPTGLTAVPGTRTIELVWERNSEKDFAGYRIYRDGKKIADGESTPAFSDRDVKPGARYRYQVSAVDTAGNESALSGAVEAAIP